jgi:glycosyltransferase involved in cell wall biosynthesis
MRVAVYGISKNEEVRVQQWAQSAATADCVVLLDTGSTDRTAHIAREAGADVHVETIVPWRFDVARNRSLELVPDDIDICISLDLDEVLLPGWREELELAYESHLTRYRYLYTWSWNDDGQPGLQYAGDKIHSRHGYTWKYPVHEVLTPLGSEVQGWVGLQIHHLRDQEKDRSQYLPLLELAVAEDPHNDRNAHYLAREYMYETRYNEAAREFKRHLALPTALWDAERSQSMRYLAVCEPENSEHWLRLAIAEAPNRREPWADIAFHYFNNGRWAECLDACNRGLALDRRPQEYLTEAHAWGSRLDDMAANASLRMYNFAGAVKHGERAVALEPTDVRLQLNLAQFRRELATWGPALVDSHEGSIWRSLPTASVSLTPEPSDLPDGWVIMNSSIATDGERLCMAVRAVNYRLINDRYEMPEDDGVIRARTGIVDVAPDGTTSNWRWIDDSAARSESPLFPVHGVEDIRLFFRKGRWWALGAIRDFASSGAIRQVLSELVEDDGGARLENPWRLPSPLSNDPGEQVYEKNWVVIPALEPGLDAIWSTEPFVRLRLDALTHQVVTVKGRPSRLASIDLRGSSPVFTTPHGPVYVMHRVGPLLSDRDRPIRTYLHAFVTFCGDHVHVGPHWTIEELSLEFVAGACFLGEHVYLSYGRDDASSRLAICDWSEVAELVPQACPRNL